MLEESTWQQATSVSMNNMRNLKTFRTHGNTTLLIMAHNYSTARLASRETRRKIGMLRSARRCHSACFKLPSYQTSSGLPTWPYKYFPFKTDLKAANTGRDTVKHVNDIWSIHEPSRLNQAQIVTSKGSHDRWHWNCPDVVHAKFDPIGALR
jgi:hypothetical protein